MDQPDTPTPPPEQPTPPPEQPSPPPEQPRRIYRSRDDRVLAGVAGGLGRYFGVDPLIFRIALLVLVFAGGSGILLYLAAALLMPNEPEGAAAPPPRPPGDSNRTLTVILVIVGVILVSPLLLGAGLLIGGILLPIAILALAGLAVWWLVSGEGPSGTGRDTARRIVLGLGVLIVCTLIAFGGFWAAAAGGGVLVASLVFAAGAALMIGAFAGGRGLRWLILPALSLALPVAFVSAAGIEMDGGVGEREYRPGSAADVRDQYELGMGSLVVDLREADLPPGDRDLKMDVGIGEALLIVPEDVCVASNAEIGMGAVNVFDRDNGGVDIDWEDLPTAPSGTPRIVVDADVGLGVFEVRHTYREGWERDHGPFGEDGPFRDGRFDGSDAGRNDACSSDSTAALSGGEPRG